MTEPPLAPATRARVAVPFILVTLIWGGTWLVIRDQISVVPIGWSVTWRFVSGAAAMLLYARVTGVPLRLSAPQQGLAVLIGFAQFVLNFNFVYRAETFVTSGLVAVVYALLVVPNAILGRIFLGAQVSRAFLAGSAVAFLGIALLFRHEMAVAAAGPHAVAVGIVIAMAGVLSASAANILQATKRAREVPILALLGWVMLWGALIDAAFAWATVGPPVIDTSWRYLAGTAYLGVLGSAVAFPLYFGVIRIIGPARAAYTSVLIPVIAMALSTLFEGYVWSLEAAAGGALVLVGLVIALAARRR
ncbi:DMT family transporter [Sphingomonas quercus]|uniref:DMT family transporter n=1 Tax=Sphingomonas quercus TaxID=2842451 RepID=A0ABS6BJ49_9SPHN|nr:DMT family transporter [Sphingomonas quercus]MBU3078328.1 DMT family transporter [Sphingomonas quercus]